MQLLSAQLGASPGKGSMFVPYVAQGIDFQNAIRIERDGSLTSVIDTKKMILSYWIKLAGGDGISYHAFYGGSAQPKFERASNNKFFFYHKNAANQFILNLNTSNTYLSQSAHYHVLMSVDLTPSPVAHIYIDDVSDYVQTTLTSNATFDHTKLDYAIGGIPTGVGAELNGCLADFYWNTEEYLDFSIEANRRLFIDASGNPVSLGADGSLPTGNQPAVFCTGPLANWKDNAGYGGSFTEYGGTLAECSSNP